MFTRSASFAMERTCRTVVCIFGQRISRLHACTVSGVEKVAKTAVVWSTGSFTCCQCVLNLFPVLCWLSKMAAVIFYDDCTTLWEKKPQTIIGQYWKHSLSGGVFCDHIHVYDGSETHCDILNSSRDCYKNEEFKLILIKFTFANMDLYMNIWNNNKKLKFVWTFKWHYNIKLKPVDEINSWFMDLMKVYRPLTMHLPISIGNNWFIIKKIKKKQRIIFIPFKRFRVKYFVYNV